jgi:NADPH:quinone reductase
MRAVWMTAFGPPEVLVLGDAPDPVPPVGEALIEVSYANLTFVETLFRATGFGRPDVSLPMIPGNGVGGMVVAVGPETDQALVGRRVVTGTGGSRAYAELVTVPLDDVFAVPDALELDVALALLADGRTAMMLMDAARVRTNETVLVEAAAGGVGSLLVQLGRDVDARVVALCGGRRKTELARSLGAHVAIDYREETWPDDVRTAVGAVDIVFDGVGGDVARAAFSLTAAGGRFVSFGLASGTWADITAQEAAQAGVTLVKPESKPEELRSYTAAALASAASGHLRPVIGQRFPLAEAAAAHSALESRRTVGKTLLVVRPE